MKFNITPRKSEQSVKLIFMQVFLKKKKPKSRSNIYLMYFCGGVWIIGFDWVSLILLLKNM